MSSEQQERQAIQYAERSTMFTVKVLLKLLEWSARHALAQDSAYKVGVQKLEELLQSPYAIESESSIMKLATLLYSKKIVSLSLSKPVISFDNRLEAVRLSCQG